MGFSRQEYWSGLPCSPPGDLPTPGTELASLMPPALAGSLLLAPPYAILITVEIIVVLPYGLMD